MKNFKLIIILLISIFILAACGGAQSTEPANESAAMSDDAMMEDGADGDMMEDGADGDMMEEGHNDAMTEEGHDSDMDGAAMEDGHDDDMADSMDDDTMAKDGDEAMPADEPMGDMADLPAWQHIELTNARTGETFTLADFAGKPVFVEPMATWCTNCRRQLGNVRDARAQIGDGAVFIGLSLETNISDAELAQYQSDQGFDWIFAVMTPEMLQQLADAFGRSITSAPSTPHFVIRPDGSTTDLVTGIEPPEQIVQQIQAANG